MAFELIDGVDLGDPPKRHRPTDERKAAVIEEAFSALRDGNYTEVARQYRAAYYGKSSAKDELCIEGRNQAKNVAKKLRKRASK